MAPISLVHSKRAAVAAGFMIASFTAYSSPRNITIKIETADSAVPSRQLNEPDFRFWMNTGPRLVPENDLYPEERSEAMLATIEEDYNQHGNNRKTLSQLLRALNTKKLLRNKKVSARFFTDLARISARLKLYPLAMQSYYQASEQENELPYPGGDRNRLPGSIISGAFLENALADNGPDTITKEQPFTQLLIDTLSIRDDATPVESEPTSIARLVDTFYCEQPVRAYALIILVKQPLPGKRKAFTGIGNVGHMFITLVQYRADNSVVSRSFGFYPDKHTSFVATPLHPGAPPVFKDDALHDWDEMAGKFISRKRFEKILRLLDTYEKKAYHLSQNNCTDFGLTVAAIGGIAISQTHGQWPFGQGNNPANAGQSILENKIQNTDTGNLSGLFICNNQEFDPKTKSQ